MIFDRYPCLREVLVNTKTGMTFKGALWRKRRGYLVLRNATMLRPGGEAHAVSGEVLIDASNIDFIQVL
jgi:small nuclear ribonucleoprotein (snRNP)-like protein